MVEKSDLEEKKEEQSGGGVSLIVLALIAFGGYKLYQNIMDDRHAVMNCLRAHAAEQRDLNRNTQARETEALLRRVDRAETVTITQNLVNDDRRLLYFTFDGEVTITGCYR